MSAGAFAGAGQLFGQQANLSGFLGGQRAGQQSREQQAQRMFANQMRLDQSQQQQANWQASFDQRGDWRKEDIGWRQSQAGQQQDNLDRTFKQRGDWRKEDVGWREDQAEQRQENFRESQPTAQLAAEGNFLQRNYGLTKEQIFPMLFQGGIGGGSSRSRSSGGAAKPLSVSDAITLGEIQAGAADPEVDGYAKNVAALRNLGRPLPPITRPVSVARNATTGLGGFLSGASNLAGTIPGAQNALNFLGIGDTRETNAFEAEYGIAPDEAFEKAGEIDNYLQRNADAYDKGQLGAKGEAEYELAMDRAASYENLFNEWGGRGGGTPGLRPQDAGKGFLGDTATARTPMDVVQEEIDRRSADRDYRDFQRRPFTSSF